MKKFEQKRFIRKMDEMEKHIALKSQRIALVYILVALLLWSFYESYQVYAYHTKLNLFPCFLLVSTCWVLIISQAIFKKKSVGDDAEYQKENPIWKPILLIILAAGAIAAIGSFLLISGVLA